MRDSLGQGEFQRVEVLRDSREPVDQKLYERVEKELGLDQPGDNEIVHQLQEWPSDFTSKIELINAYLENFLIIIVSCRVRRPL